jgi:hypothetical protein
MALALALLGTVGTVDTAWARAPDQAGAAGASSAPVAEVAVHAVKAPLRVPVRVLASALAARTVHPDLATAAEVRFALVPRTGALPDAVQVLLVEGDRAHPLALDATGHIPIPAAALTPDSAAELVVQLRHDLVEVRPDVRTGVPVPEQRRLGDLRLECEMRWRMEYDQASLAARMALKLVGSPCSSARFEVLTYAGRPLTDVRIVEGARTQELPIRAGARSFQAPLADPHWTNEAQIELHFAP